MEKVLDLKMPGVQVLGKEELKEVEGGKLHTLLWYIGYGYQKAKQRGYEVDMYLTFI